MSYLNGETPDGDLDAVLARRGYIALTAVRSGNWVRLPSIFRLLLGGTGTVTIDTGNSAGVIVEAAKTYTLVDEDGRIEFPFFGVDVTHMRATLTDTATCEVM